MVAMNRPSVVLVVLLGVMPGIVRAQLADCPALSTAPQTYKVVLDELRFASPQASTTVSGLRELLAFNLSTQLAEFQAEVTAQQGNQNVPLGLITCTGRQPSVDGWEFTAARAETLSDQRVVLELWGTLVEDPGAGHVAAPHAIIGYVVPPLLHYEPNGTLAGKLMVRYPKNSTTDPAQSLQKLSEASAFALLGLALKAQRSRKYDLAVWALTRSEGQIRDAEVAGGLPFAASMRQYLQRSACETRETARADASYQGALRLLPAENCGAAP